MFMYANQSTVWVLALQLVLACSTSNVSYWHPSFYKQWYSQKRDILSHLLLLNGPRLKWLMVLSTSAYHHLFCSGLSTYISSSSKPRSWLDSCFSSSLDVQTQTPYTSCTFQVQDPTWNMLARIGMPMNKLIEFMWNMICRLHYIQNRHNLWAVT